MEILINIVMIICFLMGIFFLVAELTGKFLAKLSFRVLGILGTILPIIYFLKIFEII